MSKWYVAYSDDDILHHGTKGMKWHHRKVGTNESQRNLYARRNANTSSKGGSVSRDNGKSYSNIYGQMARTLRLGKVTDKNINDIAKLWNKMSKTDRSTLLSVFRSNNPKAYRKLVTYIARYNKSRTKKPTNTQTTQTSNKRVTNTKDPVGSSTGLVGVASRYITNRSRTRSGGSGGRY